MDAPALTFLAPPSQAAGPDEVLHDVTAAFTGAGRGGGSTPSAAGEGLRMTRGAREAAAGMDVPDADVRRCLDEPTEVSPDPTHAGRARFSRGDLTVTAGADGMVLRVVRRGR